MVQAVVVDPGSPGRLALAEVEEPSTLPSEALVRVAAISLNRGEVRRAESSEPGFRLGWDLAGTVERAAADGSGETAPAARPPARRASPAATKKKAAGRTTKTATKTTRATTRAGATKSAAGRPSRSS